MFFSEKLTQVTGGKVGICVGLDPVYERLPRPIREERWPLFTFCEAIVQATADLVSAFKINSAFFERYGSNGWVQMERLLNAIPEGPIVIMDAKRGDVPHTAEMYAEGLLRDLRVDAITVNPYLGEDAIAPFLQWEDKGAFILALTSNPGALELQGQLVDGIPLYERVIRIAKRMNGKKNLGLVVGATHLDQWQRIRDAAEPLPLLVPGVGAQGGDLTAVLNYMDGYPAPLLINFSRSVIYASDGDDFVTAARREVMKMKEHWG